MGKSAWGFTAENNSIFPALVWMMSTASQAHDVEPELAMKAEIITSEVIKSSEDARQNG
jgi:hypothetical protein